MAVKNNLDGLLTSATALKLAFIALRMKCSAYHCQGIDSRFDSPNIYFMGALNLLQLQGLSITPNILIANLKNYKFTAFYPRISSSPDFNLLIRYTCNYHWSDRAIRYVSIVCHMTVEEICESWSTNAHIGLIWLLCISLSLSPLIFHHYF